MDGGFHGRKIYWHVQLSNRFRAICLLLIAIWMNVATISHGQQPGFLSIYCGSPANIPGTNTTLEYVTDVNSTYITTGFSGRQTSQPFNYFRFFPERRNKYCYELPTIMNTTYLFRATFVDPMLTNLSLPIEFIVSIDATTVYTMKYDPNVSYGTVYGQDVIFYSPDNTINVCLQPVVGMAFISVLELRSLDPAMYSYGGSTRQYLTNLQRWNSGANSTTVTQVRFPEDAYDRIWYNAGEIGLPISSDSTAPDTEPRSNVNNVPPAVMKDAWSGQDMEVIFSQLFSTAPVYVDPGQYVVYVVVYSEELNPNSSGGTMMVSLDGNPGLALTVSNNASMQVTTNFLLSADSITINLVADQGQSIIFMNAVEIYAQYNFNLSRTASADDAAITAVKNSFNLTDWEGDPCTPVPHDWLSCSTPLTDDASTQNGAACLKNDPSCKSRIGEFLRAQYSVTSLTLSNLPTSGFPLLTAAITSSPDNNLNSLTQMSITGSGVDGSTFQFLISYFSGGQLNSLDFSNNNIDILPQEIDWASLGNLVYLNLSHNELSGSLSSFDDTPFNSSLLELDLSYNYLTSVPTQWQAAAKNLSLLDLSYNRFGGEISSLDQLIEMNTESLRELYVTNNNFTGTISPWYFSALPLLTIANFDHNAIQGTLNLSTWFAAVMEASTNSTSNSIAITRQLFSFVNNSISNIVPSVKNMESAINSLRASDPSFSANGILLGGNPFCKQAKSEAEQYLCRSNVNDPITKPDNSTMTLLIVGICGGLFAFILFCITLLIMWRLWKQVQALREIQQALADQKVQPPFYRYSDLKLATKDFSKVNKLGHGGFGEVYKGMLPDQTSLAVKKLFNSQKLRVLNEFLNEVVLITGIKHRNLVQLKGCCIKDKERMLVYEFVEKGNLAQALWGSKAHGDLNWEQRFSMCVGIARGLSYLHEELQPSIIHRDIKPENILLDKDFQPKIADFGLARGFSAESSQAMYTQVAGTLGYFAPEYATQGQLSEKVDVYSYGIVVLEIISGRKCIDYSLPLDSIFLKDWVHQMQKKGLLLDTVQPELRDNCTEHEVIRAVNIGLRCVQHDPDMRPTMSQVVTMFLGNMDVQVPSEESDNSQSLFKEILSKDDHQWEYPSLPSVTEEEFIDMPLMNLGFESSVSGSSSRTSSKPLIEMSSLVGR